MQTPPTAGSIDPILGELLAHVNYSPDHPWSSRSQGDRPWQIFACFEESLAKVHLSCADPYLDEAGPQIAETQRAWATCERELTRMGIPFTRISTTGPRRRHLFFAVPG
jgi:hypothetical protein